MKKIQMKNNDYRQEGLDLKRLALFFKKKIVIILLMFALGAILGGVTYQVVKSINMPVEYQAISKLYIRFNVDESGEIIQHYNGYTWNELIHSDPLIAPIMVFSPGYDKEVIEEAIEASIISDVRLLTVTITADNEKAVREIQEGVQVGLAAYAQASDELKSITAIKSIPPHRVFWSDRTFVSGIAGSIALGLLTIIILCFRFATDDAIYVQSDLEKRYAYKALGVMPKYQKGLQPYLQELKANILHSLENGRKLVFIDIDDHADLRAQDFERILNWEEGGAMDGLRDVTGGLVWHVHEIDEDAELFNEEEEKEWTIIPLNSDSLDADVCDKMRKADGVMILTPFGVKAAPRKLERVVSLLNNQDINISGIIISEADEDYLNRYYS